MNIGRILGNVSNFAQKNAPLILTGLGIVGVGATAYTAYKSRDRIAEIVEELEEKRDLEKAYNERAEELAGVPIGRLTDAEKEELMDLNANPVEPVNTFETVRNLAGAVALPVALGIGSVCCIALSYHIMNTRVGNLAAAVATLGAERAYYERKFEKTYGKEANDKFWRPTEEQEVETVDAKGKKKVVKGEVRRETPENMHGRWWDTSEHYASDDYEGSSVEGWNKSVIDQKIARVNDIIFSRGRIKMNHMLAIMGFTGVRNGDSLGWSTSDNFDIYVDTINELDPESGEFREAYYLKWTTPRYILDDYPEQYEL